MRPTFEQAAVVLFAALVLNLAAMIAAFAIY